MVVTVVAVGFGGFLEGLRDGELGWSRLHVVLMLKGVTSFLD